MSEAKPNSSKDQSTSSDLIKILTDELRAMIGFSLSKGKTVSPSVVVAMKEIDDLVNISDITAEQLKKASRYHNAMSKLIFPALPENVLYLDQQNIKYEQRKKGTFAPKFPFIRKLIIFGGIAVAGLIACGFSQQVSSHTVENNALTSYGSAFLLNLFFLSCAAAIGATFMLLSTIKPKFSNGTYHPDMDSGYWITIVLGVISGIIITEMVPLQSTGSEDGILDDRLLLALLSGFSSQLVYNILNKLINAVESLVTGGAEVTRANEIQQMKISNEFENAKTKVNIANKMNGLRRRLKDDPDSENAASNIDAAIDDVIEDLDTGM
ncbi:MAG: hypothetical protein ACI8ZM_003461 [Crocinitomix sp.]|jgi:hypothetical protein